MASTLLIRNLQMQMQNLKISKNFKTDSLKITIGYVPENKM